MEALGVAKQSQRAALDIYLVQWLGWNGRIETDLISLKKFSFWYASHPFFGPIRRFTVPNNNLIWTI
jgi:hypothetical protein